MLSTKWIERGGGSCSWGVARPLVKSDFAKRLHGLTFLLGLPPSSFAESLTEEWLANFLQLILRRHWPETRHRKSEKESERASMRIAK